jgi:hypothetical protein
MLADHIMNIALRALVLALLIVAFFPARPGRRRLQLGVSFVLVCALQFFPVH